MQARTLIIIAVMILAACSNSNRTITLTLDMEKARVNNAAKLATQLADVSYKATVTHEGDTVNVRVGAASVSDIRRAICRQMGWPSSEGKMVKMTETLMMLRLAGIAKLKIIGDTETLDVELEKGGRCRKGS